MLLPYLFCQCNSFRTPQKEIIGDIFIIYIFIQVKLHETLEALDKETYDEKFGEVLKYSTVSFRFVEDQ